MAAKNIISEEVPGWKNLTANLTVPLGNNDMAVCRNQLRDIFRRFAEMPVISRVIEDSSPNGNGREIRKEFRENNLLGKPAFLHCVFDAWIAVRGDEGSSDQLIANKLSNIDFSYDVNGYWNNLIFLGEEKKMQTKGEDKKITSYLIRHLLGHDFGGLQKDVNYLRNTFASRKRTINVPTELPAPI